MSIPFLVCISETQTKTAFLCIEIGTRRCLFSFNLYFNREISIEFFRFFIPLCLFFYPSRYFSFSASSRSLSAASVRIYRVCIVINLFAIQTNISHSIQYRPYQHIPECKFNVEKV